MNLILAKYLLILLLVIPMTAHGLQSVFIEELTWLEIKGEIASGKSTAIYYAGSTEQNGPHLVTGKHNLIARFVASRIAKILGNALVYPVQPFAPTGNAIERTGHMFFPGSVSVDESTYALVARDIALSAAAAGFKCVVLMGDHGGGQAMLSEVAQVIPRSWPHGNIKVVHVIEAYEQANTLSMNYLKRVGLPYGDHASIIDTSELMFVSPQSVRMNQRHKASQAMGSSGYALQASAKLGQRFINYKVQSAVSKIRSPSACGTD